MATIWMWVGVSLFFIFALSCDTFLFKNRLARAHQSMRASLAWTLVWVCSALLFNGLIWLYLYDQGNVLLANQKALEFFTGYIIEKSLSVDNLFVFYLIFHQFKIPVAMQQRVLTYGIWGAIIMRLLLILIGVWLVNQFHWLLYVMGAFLLLTGIKMCLIKEKEKDLSEAVVIRLIKYFFRITPGYHEDHFFIIRDRLIYATPLFLALIFVEFSDLVFAFDSIPAIFAITTDPFIIWTSNVFAILGLRALYFLLANMVHRFRLLKYGIALILIFVGAKMLIEHWIKISVPVSLGVIVIILVTFCCLSLMQPNKQGDQ